MKRARIDTIKGAKKERFQALQGKWPGPFDMLKIGIFINVA